MALRLETNEEIKTFTTLTGRVIERLCRIWEQGEGDLNIEIRTESEQIKAKIKGGETERIS